jgi:hypothetical protein
MIDEGLLSGSLRDAADAFEFPDGVTERILAASRMVAPESRSAGSTKAFHRSRRGRIVLVTSVAALLVTGIALSAETSSVSHGSAPANSAGLPAQYRGAGGVAPGLPVSGQKSSVSKPAAPIPSGAVGQSAKVEANGMVELTIGDGTLESALAKLTDLAAADGGFVSSDQAQFGGGSSASGTIVLRVPQINFQTLVTQVQRVGDATSVTTTAQDVTGQYVDLQARIRALEASRQQYLTIMTRATSIGDVLAVQSQLDTLQSEIEQLQGQLNVLSNETTYGTLTVSVTEAGKKQPPAPVSPPTSGLSKAWHDGVGGFVSGFEWFIRIGGPLLFVLLFLAALAILGRLAWRTTRRRMI